MWDLTVSVPDHCLSFYFVNRSLTDIVQGFMVASGTNGNQ